MNNKLNVITTFSGYDSQCLALKKLGVDFDLVAWSEIDGPAIDAHNLLFPEFKDRNLGDISKIDWNGIKDKYGHIDLFTYSSPCTDISMAGQQKGIAKGSGTRSALIWEIEKAIQILHPKYLMLENVGAFTTKFRPYFDKWLHLLDEYGYDNYYSVMNSNEYGVPQSRTRVFVISKLRSEDDSPFEFPHKMRLTKTLSDVLDRNVDDSETTYLSPEDLTPFIDEYNKNQSFSEETMNKKGHVRNSAIAKMLYDKSLNPTQFSMIDSRHYVVSYKYSLCLTCHTHSCSQQYVVIPNENIHGIKLNDGSCFSIRQLTTKESFRLMGVSEEDIEKLHQKNNKGKQIIESAQLYIMAGNSIVVDCMYYIFKNLFSEDHELKSGKQLSLF